MFRIPHLLFALVVITFGVIGVSRLSFNVNLINLLPPGMPGVKGTTAFQKLHDRPDELLVTMQSSDGVDIGDSAAELAEYLADLPGLAESVQFEPVWLTEPEGLPELTAHAWLNAPPERVRKLDATLAPERIEAMLRDRIGTITGTLNPMTASLESRDPLGLGSVLAMAFDIDAKTAGGDEFATADGTFHVLKLKTPQGIHGYREISAWLEKVRQAVAAWQPTRSGTAAVEIAFTGSPAFEAEIGTGMERDMSQSVSGITFIVGLLFWLLHRRIRPLIYLLLAMLVTSLLTLGAAGLIIGTLDVMSMGFAAILMGMIEDFGVMGLHEAMRRPKAGFRSIHAAVFPSIAWSAISSAAVFGVLGLSTLPGIARMGLLTALGILIGAAVMLYGFLPLVMRRSDLRVAPAAGGGCRRFANWPGWLGLVLTLLCGGALLQRGLPGNINSTGILRPRHCQAFDALVQLQDRLQPTRDEVLWMPVIVQAKDAAQLAASMRRLETRLADAAANGRTSGHFLPSVIVPDPARQALNLPVLERLANERESLMRAMDAAGFTTEGMAFSLSVLDVWKQWSRDQTAATRWPTAGLVEKFAGPVVQRDETGITACGFVLLPKFANPAQAGVLAEIQQDPNIQVGGLEYLAGQLKEVLGNEVKRILLPAAAVMLALLFLVFKNMRERMMAVGSLAFSGLLLLGVMSATGMTWNFVNIGAVPMALGLGLDFNIHMIHALRERGADGHGIGRALAYCGLSTGLGFGALGLSDNVGLATFGMTSMIGVLATLLTAAVLLPWTWRKLTG